MRNAILAALDQKRNASPGLSEVDYATAKTGIWTAFAKFGLGVQAQSASADFGNIVEDFTVPAAGGQPTSPPTVQPGDQTTPTNSGGSVPQPGGNVSMQDTMRVAIPDGNETGIVRHLSVNTVGAIKRVTLKVDIAHTYVADLHVALVPPGRPISSSGRRPLRIRPTSRPPTRPTTSWRRWLVSRRKGTGCSSWPTRPWETPACCAAGVLDIELEAHVGTSGFAADGLLAPSVALTAAQLLAQAKSLVQQLESLGQRLSGAVGATG